MTAACRDGTRPDVRRPVPSFRHWSTRSFAFAASMAMRPRFGSYCWPWPLALVRSPFPPQSSCLKQLRRPVPSCTMLLMHAPCYAKPVWHGRISGRWRERARFVASYRTPHQVIKKATAPAAEIGTEDRRTIRVAIAATANAETSRKSRASAIASRMAGSGQLRPITDASGND
jgi:hypothetical protein